MGRRSITCHEYPLFTIISKRIFAVYKRQSCPCITCNVQVSRDGASQSMINFFNNCTAYVLFPEARVVWAGGSQTLLADDCGTITLRFRNADFVGYFKVNDVSYSREIRRRLLVSDRRYLMHKESYILIRHSPTALF